MFSLFETTDEWKAAVAAWNGIPDRPPKEYRARSRGFQVLKNDFLEKWVGTSHWAMPGVWFLPVILACLWIGVAVQKLPLVVIGALFVAGLLGWTAANQLQ